MNFLVDTNILARLSQADHPHQLICQQALTRLLLAGNKGILCSRVAIEFWSVATRPKTANGLGLEPLQAEAQLHDFEKTLDWFSEPPDVGSRWRALVNKYRVCGRQAHDARLAAFMQEHGLTHLLTLNTADFTRYEGLTLLSPEDIL